MEHPGKVFRSLFFLWKKTQTCELTGDKNTHVHKYLNVCLCISLSTYPPAWRHCLEVLPCAEWGTTVPVWDMGLQSEIIATWWLCGSLSQTSEETFSWRFQSWNSNHPQKLYFQTHEIKQKRLHWRKKLRCLDFTVMPTAVTRTWTPMCVQWKRTPSPGFLVTAQASVWGCLCSVLLCSPSALRGISHTALEAICLWNKRIHPT